MILAFKVPVETKTNSLYTFENRPAAPCKGRSCLELKTYTLYTFEHRPAGPCRERSFLEPKTYTLYTFEPTSSPQQIWICFGIKSV